MISSDPFIFDGRVYQLPPNSHWKTNPDAMKRLAWARRIEASTNSIRFVRFLDDFPVQPITNVWDDTNRPGYIDEKRFVVQTSTKVVERCTLMTTDRGTSSLILPVALAQPHAFKTPTLAEVAPIVDGKPDVTKLSEIDLEDLGRKFRWQKIAFETATGIYDQMKPSWKGNKEYLLTRLIRLMEVFIESGKIEITPSLFNQDELRRRLVITLNLGKVVQHMWENIGSENTESLVPVFDTERPIISTGDMRT